MGTKGLDHISLLMASTAFLPGSIFRISQHPSVPTLTPQDFVNVALKPKRSRKPSGKNRDKVKAARKQNHKRKK